MKMIKKKVRLAVDAWSLNDEHHDADVMAMQVKEGGWLIDLDEDKVRYYVEFYIDVPVKNPVAGTIQAEVVTDDKQ